MADTPSVILTRAADLIRDTAAATGDEASRHWEQGSSRFQPYGEATAHPQDAVWDGHGTCLTGGLADADARWIALLNPAIAPALEAWLRNEAREFAKIEHLDAAINTDHPPLAFACAVLGLVDTPKDAE